MSVIDDIKARLDIVEVVSSYATLQKSGRGFKAVCPFHTEKTPSFVVTPERQSWRCFGACATGGDVFSFVMQAEKLEFRDALQLLAQKTGVELQHRNVEQEGALHRVNRTAASFYQQTLASDAGLTGRTYLEGRGVSKEAADKFILGLSPNAWEGLKTYFLTHDIDIEDAIAAGLISRGDDGNTRDFFRNRLMFPIFDRRGNVAGFGARALDDSMPKYINTARTPVFDKRATLYALNLALDSIRQDRKAVIVEGYMDAIAAHEHGYTNVVASMGTALTEQQVSLLRSSADSFVLALDPDVAGQEATLRSLESSWHVIQSGAAQQRKRSHSALAQVRTVDLRVAALPAGQDPDALIREDPAKWERTVEEASSLLEFLIPAVVARFDLSSEGSRAQIVKAIWPFILALHDLDQNHYQNRLASAIGVTFDALIASVGGKSRGGQSSRQWAAPNQSSEISESALDPQRDDVLEDTALALMISRPDLRLKASRFGVMFLRKTENREVFTNWMACAKIEDLWESLDEALHPHLTHLTNFKLTSTDPRRDESGLEQMLKRLESRYWRELQETLLASENPDQPPSKELEHQVIDVNARIRESEPMRTGHQ